MPTNTIMISIIIITLIGFSSVVLFAFRSGNIEKFRKAYGYAIINLTEPSAWDMQKVYDKLNIIFQKLLEVHPIMRKKFKNSIDFYEDFLFFIESQPINYAYFNVKSMNVALKSRLFELANLARAENPFASIPPREANLLQMLSNAIKTDNKDLGTTTLKQLVQQIELTNNDLNSQRKRNNISYILAIVGFILTIFFGVISLIGFIKG
ncbi:MAG: hypothetical protein ACRYFB_09410 [Janthinobacterium lividum]